SHTAPEDIGTLSNLVKILCSFFFLCSIALIPQQVVSEQVEMAMTSAKFKVVMFDGTGNFRLWQTSVKDLLAQQGILKVLRSQKPTSMDDEDWEELQQHAAGTIRLCLADEIMLYGLKMQEGFDLAQHVNVFNQIITDLASLDVNIEDEDKAMILLFSLPFSYKHLVTTLTYGKETIKVDEISSFSHLRV
ncbi:UNVERIFIED_CONTAM: Retrovirus-related Pol polyprotein from transposon TNT 1-94, partial [Sesamum radiatum]